MQKSEMFRALTTFLGVIIGAGIFAIPYVVAKSGVVIGMVYLIFLGLIITLISLYLGEIVLRTKERHQLSGLAEKYLGEKGKWVMYAAVFFSLYGALFAYVQGAGIVLVSLLGLKQELGAYLFFMVFAFVLALRFQIFEKFEEIFTSLKVIAVIGISIVALFFMHPKNLTQIHWSAFFLPYGIILFALTGVSAIPEMVTEVRKKVIIYGMALTVIIYALFMIATIGVLGENAGEVTTVALGEKLGNGMLVLLEVFTLLALATAFVGLGFALKENYMLDFKMQKNKAWVLVIGIPLLLLVTGVKGFAKVLEWNGVIGIGVMFLLILVMHVRAKKVGKRIPEFTMPDWKWLKILIAFVICAAVVYELIV